MRKSVSIRFATLALIAPIALLLVAIPSIPAGATNAKQADALCKKNANCDGGWGKNGEWGATVCNPGDECRVVSCPAKGECVVSQRRGTKVLGILKPPTAGIKPATPGKVGPKDRPPTAGVKFPTGSKRPPSFKPPVSGKRR
jgi:hypothetical protein